MSTFLRHCPTSSVFAITTALPQLLVLSSLAPATQALDTTLQPDVWGAKDTPVFV